MSQENVEAVKRAVDTFNRRDIDAFLEDCDSEAEFHLALQVMLGGESAVYRGHDRIVAIGHLRGRGKTSGAGVESPIGYVVEYKNGKVIRMDDYFDPKEALDSAGLRE